MLDERGVAEKFDKIVFKREAWNDGAGINEQVVTCIRSFATCLEERMQPICKRYGAREDQNVFAFKQSVPSLLAQQHKLLGLVVVVGLFQQHGRWHPKLFYLDSAFAVIFFRMLKFEELGAALNMVVVRVGEGNDIEIVAIGLLEVLFELCLQVNFWCIGVFGLFAMAEVK